MNTSLTLVIVIVIAVLGLGYLVGKLITLRSGMIRAAAEASDIDTSGLEWSTGIGAWLTVAAAGAMLVISIVGIVKRR